MRVLITGGGGNLGRVLAPALEEAGHEPVLTAATEGRSARAAPYRMAARACGGGPHRGRLRRGQRAAHGRGTRALRAPAGHRAVGGGRGERTFARWEQEAIASLEEFDREIEQEGGRELRRHQAEALSRVAATDALREVAEVGLLPEAIVSRAAEAVAAQEKSDR